MVSADNQLLLLLTAGIVGAIACGVATCSTSLDCERRNTCVKSSNAICGFSNRVGVFTDVTYNANASVEGLSTMLRGLCSPGDRTQLNPSTNEIECVPYFPFPSAINPEIMDADASSPAGHACGKWIDAGGLSTWTQVVTRGNYDNGDWVGELEKAEDAATKPSRIATTAMAKFRAECDRTALAGPAALRSAAVRSYAYMEEYIDTTAVDRNGFLQAIGFQASHGCEATAGAFVGLYPDGIYKISVYSDWIYGSTTMSASLHLVGEPIDIQTQADEANAEITGFYKSGNMTNITDAQSRQILIGASGLTDVSSAILVSRHTTLVQAALQYYDSSPSKAVSYLKGVSAFCSYLMWHEYFEESLYTSPNSASTLQEEVSRLRAAKESADARGRLKAVEDNEEVSLLKDLQRVSGMKLSQVVTGGGTGNLKLDCLSLMRRFFPEEVDTERFKATISDALYARLQPMVLQTRLGAGLAAASLPVRDMLVDPDQFASRAMTAGLRITGAPRGSWAGIARGIPNGNMASTDGMFVMMLKQWRAGFHDTVVDAGIKGTMSPCDHTPFYSTTSWNAYMLIGENDCSVFFLGMAHRPIMDEQYDDVSLLSRAISVVGHEFGHITLKLGYTSQLSNLLKHYYPVTHSEAIADVLGALSILYTGLVNRYDFITNFCQIWCSREPLFHVHPPTKIHPSGNDRCNFLVYTLDEFYPDLAKDVTTRI